MKEDLVKVLLSDGDTHPLEHSGGVVGVLEVGPQVISTSLDSCIISLLPLSGTAGSLANFLGIPLY